MRAWGVGVGSMGAWALVACSAGPAAGPSERGAGAFAPALAQPQREGRVVRYVLKAEPATVQVGGRTVGVWAYNGQYPGPTLTLREGDRLELRLVNGLSEPTNLHWHGLPVPADQDQAMASIPPGGTQDFSFEIPEGSAGTYWYHPHAHGLVAGQVARGLFGALVVQAASDPLAQLPEELAVLSDLRVTEGMARVARDEERPNGFEGEEVLVNGLASPELRWAPGSRRRLRLLNASASRFYRLATPGQALTVVGSDGGLLGAPQRLPELLLVPGERAELVLEAPAQAGQALELVALPYDRGMMAVEGSGSQHAGHVSPSAEPSASPASSGAHAHHRRLLAAEPQRRLLRVLAEGPAAGALPPLPSTLRPVPTWGAEGTERQLTFTEDHLAGDFRINGQRFEHGRVDFRIPLGARELWTLENRGHMDHPFHLHGFSFQVLSRGPRPEPYAAWRDTVNVVPGEKLRLALRFERFPGLRVFHCHILDHEDLGMMGALLVE